MNMRALLKGLMALRDENAYALEERSGVPQATTNRFLTGKHGEPRSKTVRKWASAYNLTESQLRGDSPLPDTLAQEIACVAAPEFTDALLPSSNGAAAEHPAQSPGKNKGITMQSNVVRLHREEAGVEDGYVRMRLPAGIRPLRTRHLSEYSRALRVLPLELAALVSSQRLSHAKPPVSPPPSGPAGLRDARASWLRLPQGPTRDS